MPLFPTCSYLVPICCSYLKPSEINGVPMFLSQSRAHVYAYARAGAHTYKYSFLDRNIGTDRNRLESNKKNNRLRGQNVPMLFLLGF